MELQFKELSCDHCRLVTTSCNSKPITSDLSSSVSLSPSKDDDNEMHMVGVELLVTDYKTIFSGNSINLLTASVSLSTKQNIVLEDFKVYSIFFL